VRNLDKHIDSLAMRNLQESQYNNIGMLSPIELATNLVDLSEPNAPNKDVKIDVNVVNKSQKFKKLSPKIYKVKQSNMLYSITNPMVFQQENIPPSGIKTAVASRSPRRILHFKQDKEETQTVTISSLNLNQTPRDKVGRASTVEGAAEKQDFAPASPFRPALIPKLKRPVTI